MQETIEKLIGLKCFVANHIYGTMFYMDFGYPVVEFNDKGEDMSVRGEWGVSVLAASWEIKYKDQNHSVTSENIAVERKAAISDFIGQTVEDINFNSETSRLSIFFSHEITLEIYTNYAEAMKDNEAELWWIKTPHSIVSFTKGGKFEEQETPKGSNVLTVPHKIDIN